LSRTDAHSPFWVRLARGELAVHPEHAHPHPVCDLPETPADAVRPYGVTKCHWALHYTGINVCSCWMCHAGPQHRHANRTQRHGSRVNVSIEKSSTTRVLALESAIAPGPRLPTLR
jgi:hypothetical protein